MKSVLISIKPKWCELIASGKKTVEVRKTAPKEVPFKVYVYCTKKKPPLFTVVKNGDDWCDEYKGKPLFVRRAMPKHYGKVIGEFICDKVEKIPAFFERTEGTCLTVKNLDKYGYNKKGELYYWHISELKIYDEPRELYNFHRACNKKCSPSCDWYIEYDYTECGCGGKPNITRPPQSWCYVDEE